MVKTIEGKKSTGDRRKSFKDLVLASQITFTKTYFWRAKLGLLKNSNKKCQKNN
jgi:hypothetical protein